MFYDIRSCEFWREISSSFVSALNIQPHTKIAYVHKWQTTTIGALLQSWLPNEYGTSVLERACGRSTNQVFPYKIGTWLRKIHAHLKKWPF